MKRKWIMKNAASDHDALALFTDFVDVVDAGAVFNLRDDRDVFAAVFGKERLEVDQILPRGNK